MKKILFLFLAACFFFSCEKETIVIPQQHAGRTVLAFFWADNSLNSSLRDNIQTMMQGLQAMKDSAALLWYIGMVRLRISVGRSLVSLNM